MRGLLLKTPQCVFSQYIFEHKGMLGLLYLMSLNWKSCDLLLSVLGVICVALEHSDSDVFMMLVSRRCFLLSTKCHDRAVVLLCRMTTDNFVLWACILRVSSAERGKKKRQKKRSGCFVIGQCRADCFCSLNSSALWLDGMGFRITLCWIGSLFQWPVSLIHIFLTFPVESNYTPVWQSTPVLIRKYYCQLW